MATPRLKEPISGKGPTHVAIIMDGNGRWAAKRGLPRTAGHKAGADAVRRAIEAAVSSGVPYLTLFGFSSENWRRPKNEVTDLMGLLRLYLRTEIDALAKQGVRLRIIGDRSTLADDIVRLIEDGERATQHNTRLNLTVALSYGARQDLTAAIKKLIADADAGQLDPASLTEDHVSDALCTRDLPNPDLLIRTSGEKRVSNFLLWELAYAEFVFIETLWPDFSQTEFEQALAEFQERDRRFGGTQVSPAIVSQAKVSRAKVSQA